jgi:hypothetical protein
LFWWVLVFCLFCAGVVAGWPLLPIPVMVPARSAVRAYRTKRFCDSRVASAIIGGGYGAISGIFVFAVGAALCQLVEQRSPTAGTIVNAAYAVFLFAIPVVVMATVIGLALTSLASMIRRSTPAPESAPEIDGASPNAPDIAGHHDAVC